LQFEAAPEVVPSCLGLVLASPDGPGQGLLYGAFSLVADVEEASGLGHAQLDQFPVRAGLAVAGGAGFGGAAVAGPAFRDLAIRGWLSTGRGALF
jgi:hypothetical protein